MIRVVLRGQGQLNFDHLPRRLFTSLVALISQGGMIRHRPIIAFFHCFIAWGFIFYILVNIVDIVEAYIPGFRFLERSVLGSLYRMLADVLSIAIMVGMSFFLIRRFVAGVPALTYHNNVKWHPKALAGISMDSLIVGGFILAHVGFRFLGASFLIATESSDAWQPFANWVANLWRGKLPELTITIGWHISWWLALGLILRFRFLLSVYETCPPFHRPLQFNDPPAEAGIGDAGCY